MLRRGGQGFCDIGVAVQIVPQTPGFELALQGADRNFQRGGGVRALMVIGSNPVVGSS